MNYFGHRSIPGTTSWTTHRDRAIANGGRLPSSAEGRLIRLSTYSDMWIPIGDSENTWMQINPTRGDRGKTHEEQYGSKPGWGTGGNNNHQRTVVWMNTPKGPVVKPLPPVEGGQFHWSSWYNQWWNRFDHR